MTTSNHLEEKSVISKIGSEFCGLGSYVKVKKIVRVMRLPTIAGSSNMPLFLVCGYMRLDTHVKLEWILRHLILLCGSMLDFGYRLANLFLS